MKNTTKKKNFTLFATLTVLALFVVGCTGDWTVTFTFNDYTGKAVNVKSAGTSTEYWKYSSTESLEGATISLYPYDSTTGGYSATASGTATVGSAGTFTFTTPDPGRYKLNGSKTGWTFVPRYIEVSNNGSTTQDLYAYLTDTSEYTIIASWENDDIDVDLTLTYGDEAAGTTNKWNTGDTLAAPDRFRIYYGDTSFAGRGSTEGIMLNRDVTHESPAGIPRVETMSIYSSDWFADGDTIKVYVDAPHPDQLLTGNQFTATGDTAYASAIVQVDLMRRYEGADYHYGTWYVPWNTYEDTIQVIQASFAAPSTLTFGSANGVSSIKSIIWE